MLNNYYLMLTVSFLLLACQQPSMKSQQITQGVKGEIRWFEGNMMPAIGESQNTGKPVKRKIYFCKPVKIDKLNLNEETGLYSGIDEFILTSTESDMQGNYEVELAPGKYSVFTKEESGFYANQVNGEGYINMVEVEKGEITTLDIKITYKASF